MMTAADPIRAGLFRAVLEAPNDDVPRLIYADYLEECGEAARAEFIRVQCELIKQPLFEHPVELPTKTMDACQVKLLGRRERELLIDLWSRGELTQGLPGVQYHTYTKDGKPIWAKSVNGRIMEMAFRRGFVEVLTCSAEDWLRHADVLVASQPIREVRLTTLPQIERRGSLTLPLVLEHRLVGRSKWYHKAVYDSCNEVMGLLKLEWPNVQFHLP